MSFVARGSTSREQYNEIRSGHKNKSTSIMPLISTRSVDRTIFQRTPFCPCDGGCPRCAPAIQPKLKIGQPNDKYEQEADRVAEQVMRMPEPTVQRKPT